VPLPSDLVVSRHVSPQKIYVGWKGGVCIKGDLRGRPIQPLKCFKGPISRNAPANFNEAEGTEIFRLCAVSGPSDS
jgi:hypothetical protein